MMDYELTEECYNILLEDFNEWSETYYQLFGIEESLAKTLTLCKNWAGVISSISPPVSPNTDTISSKCQVDRWGTVHSECGSVPDGELAHYLLHNLSHSFIIKTVKAFPYDKN